MGPDASRTATALILTAVFMLSGLGGPADGPHGPAAWRASAQEVALRPNLMEVELVTLSEDALAVSWVTDIASSTWIEYGTTEDLEEREEVVESTRFHLIEVDGLLPATMYHYRVGSGISGWSVSRAQTLPIPGGDPGTAGGETRSLEGSGSGWARDDAGPGKEGTRTDHDPGYLFTFAVGADPHYSLSRSNSGQGMLESESKAITEAFVDEMNSRDEVEFMVLLGDMVNSGDPEEFTELAAILADLDAPYYVIPGNHDKGQTDGEEGLAELGGEHWDTGDHMWGRSDFHGRRFIGLDSAQYPYETPGRVPQEQLRFIEDELAGGGSGMPALLFAHHPGCVHEEDVPEIYGTTNQDALVDSLVNASSGGGRPMAYMAGHVHRNLLRFSNLTGALPYMVVAAMVEYPVGYGMVNVYEDGFTYSFQKIPGALQQSETSRQKQRSSYGNPYVDEQFLGDISVRSLSVTLEDDGTIDITYGWEVGSQPPGGGTSDPGASETSGPQILSTRAVPSELENGERGPVTISAQVHDPDGPLDVAVVSAELNDLEGYVDGGSPVILLDDGPGEGGEGADDYADDGWYSAELEFTGSPPEGEYVITASAVDSVGLRGTANVTLIVTGEEEYDPGDGDESGGESGDTPGFTAWGTLAALCMAATALWGMASRGGRRRRSG